jgi:cytochrome P450
MAVSQERCRHAPAWSQDLLDSSEPPEVQPPLFDATLGAWVLTRRSDIVAALRTSTLAMTGFDSAMPETLPDEGARKSILAETLDALSPTQLQQWREWLAPQVEALISKLPQERPVDVLEEYAMPLCLLLAARATGISTDEGRRLMPDAREVSAAAADPGDSALKARAKVADTTLRGHFSTGPVTLRDSGFVALSQTVPCLLGNAWFALIQHPDQWWLLHNEPALIDQAVEELLRYAGLVRVLFRVATADIDLDGLQLRKGTRLILRIIAGNRDQAHFEDPNTLNIARRGSGHLSLGMGPHACAGANLIRMAMKQITLPLVTRFKTATLAEPVEWQGGWVFRSPRSLWVHLG